MSLELLAIDQGKRSFHLYGIDTDGVILSQKVSRAKLTEMVGTWHRRQSRWRRARARIIGGDAGSPPAALCASSTLVS
jgi:hypothetical protein